MKNIVGSYFMDDRREAGRLESKVNAPAFVEKYLEPFLHPETGTILEVGCGPGMFLEVLARKYPGVSIKGIDISADRIGIARHRLAGLPSAEALQASVYHLPFPDRYFDFIYSRFLFEYLDKPVEAARELFRVCKPGGLLFLQDLDNQFSFYPALSDKLQACLEQLKEVNGFDPEIGRKLYSIGKAAGFSPSSGEVEAYHQVWGAANEETMRQWQLKLDIAFKNLDASLGSKCAGLKEEMLQSLQSADSVMYSTVFSVAFRKE
jgi:ubiquinone/menaquinone biosynthesis C-methylase UbiE